MEDQATTPVDGKGEAIKEAITTAGNYVKKGLNVDEFKEKAAHALEDGITDAKRMIKRGRYAAEDLVEDTAHYIKRDPWRSVGTTFAVGFGLGLAAGILLARNYRKN